MGGGHLTLNNKKAAKLVTSPVFSPQEERLFHPFYYFQGQESN